MPYVPSTHTHTHTYIHTHARAVVLKAGKEGRYENEGYGERPYDNWETIEYDCEGKVGGDEEWEGWCRKGEECGPVGLTRGDFGRSIWLVRVQGTGLFPSAHPTSLTNHECNPTGTYFIGPGHIP